MWGKGLFEVNKMKCCFSRTIKYYMLSHKQLLHDPLAPDADNMTRKSFTEPLSNFSVVIRLY